MYHPVEVSEISGPVVGTSLQRTLREQQTLLDSAGVGIVFIRNRIVVHCNQRYAEIYGYASPQELLGHSSETLHPNRDAFRALGREAYTTLCEGQTFRCERQMRRRDGTLFWASLTGRLINPQDTREGSIWTVDDIDEHKQTQDLLRTIQLEKQVLFDQAMVGIVFLRERHLTRCNRHFEQMLGYEPGELIGSPSRRWYRSDAEWEDAGKRCYAPFAQGQSFAGEVTLCRKDGTPVVCDIRAKAMGAQGSVWIAMDITERKRTQEALAKAHEELERQVRERTRELHETVVDLHREIVDRKEDQDRIHWLAHYDALTGLPNRTLLAERSQQAIREAASAGKHAKKKAAAVGADPEMRLRLEGLVLGEVGMQESKLASYQMRLEDAELFSGVVLMQSDAGTESGEPVLLFALEMQMEDLAGPPPPPAAAPLPAPAAGGAP